MTDTHQVWFASFVAGFGPLVRRLVGRDVPGAGAFGLEDNALRFECDREPRQVLAYCRSLFRVLGERGVAPATAASPAAARLAGRGGDAAELLGAAASLFARDRDALGAIAFAGPRAPGRGARSHKGSPSLRDGRGPGGFVLRAFGPDDPAPLPEAARRGLEEAIARASGARPDPRGDRRSREYRMQARSDGTVLFLERRDDGPGRAEEPSRPGELPRTTCRLLAELTDPRPDDVFLDPFCGYGGVALERALAAPYRFVFASDLDPAKVAAVKEALRDRAFERRRRTFFPKVRDALEASSFEAGFVDAIAADPPWGLYEGGPGAEKAAGLLEAFAREAARELGAGGRLVLLVGRDQAGQATEAARGAFGLRESFDVLISGKKASALRFDRKG